MPAHIRLHRRFPLRDEHFDRWLDLFCDVVDARFVGPMAENTKHRARGIARAIRLKTVGSSTPRVEAAPGRARGWEQDNAGGSS